MRPQKNIDPSKKRFTIKLLIGLFLISTLGFISPVVQGLKAMNPPSNNASGSDHSFTEILTNVYPVGTCNSGAPQWEDGNGTSLTKITTSVSGSNTTVPSGSVIFPIVGSGTSTSQCSASTLTYGLVGYWPLQEGTGDYVYDVSGNNNTGTLENSPSWVNGNGLNFTGSNYEYVSLPAGGYAGSAMTWCATVNASSFPNSDNAIVSSSGGNTMLYVTPAGYIHVGDTGIGDSGAIGNIAIYEHKQSFVCISLTENPNPIATLYINGTMTGSHSFRGLATTGTAAVLGYGSVGETYWNGVIKNFEQFNYLLSNSTISELYHYTEHQLEHRVTSPGQIYTARFYPQYLTNVTQNGNPNTSTFGYSNIGLPRNLSLTTSFQSVWVDATNFTFSDNYLSTNNRYSSDDNGTIYSSSNLNATYYNQFYIKNQKNLALTPTEYGRALNVTMSSTWADNTSILKSTGIVTFTFIVMYGGTIYQESSHGFQLLSSNTIYDINYSLASNRLSFVTSGESYEEVGIVNGLDNYHVSNNGSDLKYSIVGSVVFFTGNDSTNDFAIISNSSNSNTLMTTVTSNSSSHETTTHQSLFAITTYLLIMTGGSIIVSLIFIMFRKEVRERIEEYLPKYWTIPFIVSLIVMFTVSVTLLSQGNTSGAAKVAICTISALVIGMLIQIGLYIKQDRELGNTTSHSSAGSWHTIRFLRENWGAPFVFAFIALILSAAIISDLGNPSGADSVAVYAFYIFMSGVILQAASNVKHGSRMKSNTAVE